MAPFLGCGLPNPSPADCPGWRKGTTPTTSLDSKRRMTQNTEADSQLVSVAECVKFYGTQINLARR
jgi:hypothetical protein